MYLSFSYVSIIPLHMLSVAKYPVNIPTGLKTTKTKRIESVTLTTDIQSFQEQGKAHQIHFSDKIKLVSCLGSLRGLRPNTSSLILPLDFLVFFHSSPHFVFFPCICFFQSWFKYPFYNRLGGTTQMSYDIL